MKQQVARESNFELLRIIAMLMIILNHYVEHGLDLENLNYPFGLNLVLSWFMKYGGKFGCFLFILITGYFMIHSSFKLNKFILLILEIWFYSVAVYVVLAVGNMVPVSGKYIIKALLPVEGSWFVKVYLLIYILTIFINPMVKSLSREKLLALICVLMTVMSVLPTLFAKDLFGFERVDYFVLTYIIGAYIRLYPCKLMDKKKVWGSVFVVFYLTYIVLCLSMYKMGKDPLLFSKIFSFSVMGGAIALFLLFRNYHFYNKQINYFASMMLGIYLLHDNIMLRSVLWENWFKVQGSFKYNWFFPYALGSALLILIIGGLIDFLRSRLVEKNIKQYLDTITVLNKINMYLNEFIEN